MNNLDKQSMVNKSRAVRENSSKGENLPLDTINLTTIAGLIVGFSLIALGIVIRTQSQVPLENKFHVEFLGFMLKIVNNESLVYVFLGVVIILVTIVSSLWATVSVSKGTEILSKISEIVSTVFDSLLKLFGNNK